MRQVTLRVLSAVVIGLLVVSCQSQAPAAPVATSAPAAAPATAAPSAPAQAPAAPTAQAPSAPSTPAPAAATPAASQGAQPKTLKVGISLGITGPAVRIHGSMEKFLKLAIDEVNAKGIKVGNDTYRMESITVDDKLTAEGGRDAANRLVLAEKVKFIFGEANNPLAGAQAITEPNKVIAFSVSASDPSLGPKFPLSFQVGLPHQRMRAAALYDWLKKDYPATKRVTLALSDDTTGRAYEPMAVQAMQARGMSVAAKEYFPLEIKDMNPVVARIVREKPDAIDANAAYAPSFAGFIAALHDQGYKGPLFSISADMVVVKNNAGIIEGYTTAVLGDILSEVVTPGDREAIRKYIAKHGEAELEPMALSIYNMPGVLAQAISKAGTVDDTVKIAETLRAGEWNTSFGTARFVGAKTYGLASVLEAELYFSKVQAGKVVTFQGVKTTMQ